MTNGERYWCWWLHRYLYYIGKRGDKFRFADVADLPFDLDWEQVQRLKVDSHDIL